MNDKQKEFFVKFAQLCNEYDVIGTSGRINFYKEIADPGYKITQIWRNKEGKTIVELNWNKEIYSNGIIS